VEAEVGLPYNRTSNLRETRLVEFEITFEREEDGRWIAEIEVLPGVLAYGATKLEAQSKVEALALRVIARSA